MSTDQNISEVDFPSEINKNIYEKRKSSNAQSKLDLDDVLTITLGEFGWFQLRNIVLLAIPIAMSAFKSEYVFSDVAVQHRCRISECKDGKFYPYKPDWLQDVVPRTSSEYSSCERYVSANKTNKTNKTNDSLDYCPSYLFDQRNTVGCDGFVYATDNSVVSEFDLGCQDFLRAFVGTLNSIGMLPGLPITGYISDNYGRKWALIISVFNVGLFGLICAFSVNYTMYMVLQLLQTTLGAGAFSSAYIFGNGQTTEIVGPKYRVITSATLFSIYAVGQVILRGVVWLFQPWRFMIMALHIPYLLIDSYYWFLSESIRWLLSKKKYTEAKTVLEKVARVNKTLTTEKSIETLILTSMETVQTTDMNYWHGIPSMMFAVMGILSGIIVLTQPETLGVKMPDTLAEAESLGKQTEK